MITKRKGIKCLKTFRKGDEVIGMVNFRDHIIIATKKSVYILKPKIKKV